MFDTLAVARELTEAGVDRAQADVLANAIRQAAEHGDHVTPARLDAAVARLDAAMGELELRLVKWIVGTGVAAVAAGVGILRLLDGGGAG